MKKVKYINSFSIGSHHLMFNEGLYVMLSKIYPLIQIYSTPSAYSNFKKDIPNIPNNHPLVSISGNSRFRVLCRYLVSTIYNILIFLFSSSKSILIYNFNNIFSTPIINLLNLLFKKKIIIFCHGELEDLTNTTENASFVKRIFINLTKLMFVKNNYISPYIYYVVAGDSILQNLSKYTNSRIYIQFFSVDHPIFISSKTEKEIESLEKLSCIDKIHIGTVGVLNKYKGLENYLNFIDFCNRDDIEYYVVGNIQEGKQDFVRRGVIVSDEEGHIPLSKFRNQILALDAILYFYSNNSYILTASGALFDAIIYKKPIYALKNPYFEYIFQKFCSFGKLYDDVKVMADDFNANNFYLSNFSQNIIQIKNKLSPDILYNNLKNHLVGINFILDKQ